MRICMATTEAGTCVSCADTLRHVSNAQLAALIAKGIDQFPENTDRLVGTIDIWWIVRILGLVTAYVCLSVVQVCE